MQIKGKKKKKKKLYQSNKQFKINIDQTHMSDEHNRLLNDIIWRSREIQCWKWKWNFWIRSTILQVRKNTLCTKQSQNQQISHLDFCNLCFIIRDTLFLEFCLIIDSIQWFEYQLNQPWKMSKHHLVLFQIPFHLHFLHHKIVPKIHQQEEENQLQFWSLPNLHQKLE